ncbi:MAG: GntR family transcriptional regulator [bacterium]
MKLQPRVQRFEKVKAALISAIVSGQFNPGDRLPSLRDLSVNFKVSLATVQLAVKEMKDEEWLVTVPCKGVSVAEPLPPIAHLMRLKDARKLADHAHNLILPRQSTVELKCLVYDEALLPVFEWAAREYAEAYAPYSLRVEVQPLAGGDEEAIRNMDADLILLPSYAASRAMRIGVITPCDGMLGRGEDRFADIPKEIVDMVSYEGKRWGMPLMVGAPILVANEGVCRTAGIDAASLTDVDSLLKAVETAAGADLRDKDALVFCLTFIMPFLISAGFDFPGITHVSEMMARPAVRALLERLKQVAHQPAVAVTRFDHWDTTDYSRVAVGHYPSSLFCRDLKKRAGAHVLPIPGAPGGALTAWAYSMCVSTRSVHVFEAWDWASHLGGVAFQTRLAELSYDVPASANAQVCRAFEGAVGEENARTLQALIRKSSHIYQVGTEDAMRYVWEVLGNELYGFVTGKVDYERMSERVKTKTERYLLRAGNGELTV